MNAASRRLLNIGDMVSGFTAFLQIGRTRTAPAEPTGRQLQRAIASLHRAELRVSPTSGPRETQFYDICAHCTELLNQAVEPGDLEREMPWPCDTAIAARLHELPAVTPEQLLACRRFDEEPF